MFVRDELKALRGDNKEARTHRVAMEEALEDCRREPSLAAVLEELLPLATTNGALAVGIDPAVVNLQPGPVAGVIHADLDWSHVGAPEWILRPEQNDSVHVSGRKEIKLQGRYNPMS